MILSQRAAVRQFVIELLWDGSEGTANLLEDMTQLEGDYSAVQ